ncbi:response regulator transcription factor [Thiomicrospira microaerophila]|uniref:response regulator transcription factor n=1 Tax=Thiomicrospira microaerophila TaxID=406020 RepID=UPI0018E069D9|nr:response regulator transcription factor [Thiomicrospira microaerophila]
MNILLVEDQPLIQQSLIHILESERYQVDAFESAEQALGHITPATDWPLAILDISLPGIDGITLAQRLRAIYPAIGIIMLTMHQDLDKKLQSYEAGADIFLSKPIAAEELIATIGSLTKRLRPSTEAEPDITPILLANRLRFDPVKQKIWLRDGTVEALSLKEAKILNQFRMAKNQQLEYWELLETNQLDFDTKGRKQLEVIMSRLRQKLVRISERMDCLIALRGVGYKLTLELFD